MATIIFRSFLPVQSKYSADLFPHTRLGVGSSQATESQPIPAARTRTSAYFAKWAQTVSLAQSIWTRWQLRRVTTIMPKRATQTFPALDLAIAAAHFVTGLDDLVGQTLVILSFVII